MSVEGAKVVLQNFGILQHYLTDSTVETRRRLQTQFLSYPDFAAALQVAVGLLPSTTPSEAESQERNG